MMFGLLLDSLFLSWSMYLGLFVISHYVLFYFIEATS